MDFCYRTRMLAKQLKTCEVAVGALASETGRTTMVVTEEMVSNMRPGSVIIDVSIDRGGCFETSEITSHEHPSSRGYGWYITVYRIYLPGLPVLHHRLSVMWSCLCYWRRVMRGALKILWHKLHLRSGIYLSRERWPFLFKPALRSQVHWPEPADRQPALIPPGFNYSYLLPMSYPGENIFRK